MMKTFFSFLFVIASITCFSQTKEIKFKKDKINNVVTISDLISDISKDCKVSSFVFSINVNGSLKEFNCVGGNGGIGPELKAAVNSKKKGQWFFIENIHSNCEKSHKPNYKIILE